MDLLHVAQSAVASCSDCQPPMSKLKIVVVVVLLFSLHPVVSQPLIITKLSPNAAIAMTLKNLTTDITTDVPSHLVLSRDVKVKVKDLNCDQVHNLTFSTASTLASFKSNI